MDLISNGGMEPLIILNTSDDAGHYRELITYNLRVLVQFSLSFNPYSTSMKYLVNLMNFFEE